MDYVTEMLKLQDSFNERTIPNWKEQNLDWVNAIMLEAAEQNDSLAWKWWKKGENDMDNFLVEVIDNWHFLMALALNNAETEPLASEIKELWELENSDESLDLQNKTQLFTYFVLDAKFNDPQSLKTAFLVFFDIVRDLDLDLEGLYKHYITKNVLNQFRQDNGYKTGEYKKIWGEEEDNVVAFRLVDETDTFASLYAKLDAHYKFTNDDAK